MSGRELFVPGRLCLFGEHTDWAGEHRTVDPSVETGLCLITPTDQGLYGTADLVQGCFQLQQIGQDGLPTDLRSYPLDPDFLEDLAKQGVFNSYVAGTASLLLRRFPGLGIRLNVRRRTLPLKKGLSSSAAVCVMTARAFSRIHGLNLSVEEEMELAYRGELLTGSRCGRMDQTCAFGEGAVLLNFDGDSMTARQLKPGRDIHLLVVDLNSTKDTRAILRDLNRSFERGDTSIRRALGSENHRIVEASTGALEAGDAALLGKLMIEAQEIFDTMVAPSSPLHLRSPVLHSILGHEAVSRLSLGGKGVGSQGDGTAQLVCRDDDSRRELAAILKQDTGLESISVTIRNSSSII